MKAKGEEINVVGNDVVINPRKAQAQVSKARTIIEHRPRNRININLSNARQTFKTQEDATSPSQLSQALDLQNSIEEDPEFKVEIKVDPPKPASLVRFKSLPTGTAIEL